jgi:Tfp pilus assembly protein PilV
MHQNRNTDRRSGFTIIETMVAITILMISIVSPMAIAAKGLTAAFLAQDQIRAFYLAQEAIEQIRNKRDENGVKRVGWLGGLDACLSGSHCRVDAPANTISACSGTCPALNYNVSTGFYSYGSGTATNIVRDITVQTVSDVEVNIVVTLSWKTGMFSRTITLNERLYNWQQ